MQAVVMPGFWQWGNGGDLRLKTPTHEEDVHRFLIDGIKVKALAKLTDEEKEVLGLQEK